METRQGRAYSLCAIAIGVSLSLAGYSSIVVAQSIPRSLSDRDMPTVEIYPRYPVSKTSSPGGGPQIYDPDRASVSVVIYSSMCPATLPFGLLSQQVKTSANGSRFDISGVRFGFQPVCTGQALGPVIYSVWLRDLVPGIYQTVVSSEPGDAPPDSMASTITTMVRDFVVLNLDQAGKAAIENPAPGKVQSGIGLISGWACVADRVEISIDGGPRINVQGNMPRGDVTPICGHGTAGFGLLTNFNLLGAGTHTIQAYVKGVPVGQSTSFDVVVPAGEFVRGLTQEIAIPNFPSVGKTATIDWREAEQNFGLKDVR